MKKKPNKPRDFALVALLSRQGKGAHGKTKKAQRRMDKVKMMKENY